IKHNGTFTNAIGNATHRTIPHIPYREYAGNVGFEQRRVAVESPARRALTISQEVLARENKSLGVAANRSVEPIRSRFGSDEDEERVSLTVFLNLTVVMANGDAAKVIFPVCLDHFRLWFNLDVGDDLNALHQIMRHGMRKGFRAHQHGYRARELCKMYGGLTRGVCAADDIHIFVL